MGELTAECHSVSPPAPRPACWGSRRADSGRSLGLDGGDWAAGCGRGSQAGLFISEAAGGRSDGDLGPANPLIQGSGLHLGLVGLSEWAGDRCQWPQPRFSDVASFHSVD